MQPEDYWFSYSPVRFDRGTLGWSLAARGAYQALINWIMVNNAMPPDDDAALADICRCTLEDWLTISAKVRTKFKPQDGLLFHDFAAHQLAVQEGLAKRRSEAGKTAANARWQKTKENDATRMRSQCDLMLQDRTGQDIKNPPLPPLDAAASKTSPEAPAGPLPVPEQETINRVYDAIVDLLGEPLSIVPTQPIRRWLSLGADPDRDILPAIREVAKRQPPGWWPGNLNYFERPVLQAARTNQGRADRAQKPANGVSRNIIAGTAEAEAFNRDVLGLLTERRH